MKEISFCTAARRSQLASAEISQQIFQQDFQGIGQAGDRREAGALERRQAAVLQRVAARSQRRARTKRILRAHDDS
jgi:hypothetical protein